MAGQASAQTHDDDEAAVTQIWIEVTSYLLERKELSTEAWTMVSTIRC